MYCPWIPRCAGSVATPELSRPWFAVGGVGTQWLLFAFYLSSLTCEVGMESHMRASISAWRALTEFAKLLGARALFEYFITLIVPKTLNFLEKLIVTLSEL